ncbi:MAG: VWA domain-containing protein [Bacteroidia bacterium]|nr:VWA domain-containing protein [Bacteroidia bacterium]MCZ2277068.1 VWA domain-containing protein [Bacteroidia bacterium]
MRKKIYLVIFGVWLLPDSCIFSQQVVNRNEELTRILFLFDASQSMQAQWQSNSRFEVARQLLSEMLDSLKGISNLELALRVYGHTKKFPPQDCDDTRLEVPFAADNYSAIKHKLTEIKPSGTTPIAQSLLESATDFPADPSRNIIILITDGIEECKGDPCAVSYQLQRKGIVLKPFVIGLGVTKDFAKAFECVGNYFDASNETQFKHVLNVIISQALNSTSMQVNLIDAFGKPTETNVGMTFYDQNSGAIRYNFVHTLNVKGNPDTLKVDPLIIYRIVVHTLPPVFKDSIVVTPGKHTIVGIDAPQGDLFLKLEGSNEYKNLQAIIRKSNSSSTLHVQSFNTKERFLVGKYDLEILTVPRINLSGIDISQSKTTTIEIPKPGLVHISANSSGYGSIYAEDKNELVWVYRIGENNIRESIALQPGRYRVIFRPKNSRESIYTVERTFRITPGESTSINLY